MTRVYFDNSLIPSTEAGRMKIPLRDKRFVRASKNLLDLPENVLKRILRELLVRLAEIMPGIVREKSSFAEEPKLLYRYQWSQARQEEYEVDHLPKNLAGRHIQIFWTAAPTKGESELITAGCNQLTSILESGQEIQGFIHNRGAFGVQIIHRSRMPITEISGLAILRSCKRLWTLGTTVLYGENSFVFDTRGISPFVEPQSVVTRQHLTHMPHEIPGRHHEDGTLPTARQVSRSINKIFRRNEQNSKFIHQDPLTKFFMKIGRKNASHITKVIIQGRWNWIVGKWKETGSQPVGLHDLIPIYTLILNEVCRNIHAVTLHDDDQGYPQVDKLGPPGTDRDQEISDSVEKLVQGLPNLQKLKLGHYEYVPAGCGYDSGLTSSKKIPPAQPNDEWKKALKWVIFVEERSKLRSSAEA
ncbi:hypothetical protein MFRU_038g00590 [Monilinia fructicola]|nr:hypothetical protein MFRU_038g00590 [Monilinia fructicola]